MRGGLNVQAVRSFGGGFPESFEFASSFVPPHAFVLHATLFLEVPSRS